MRMIRKQVYIEPHQEAILKQLAAAAGRSEAEVIRQGIELAASQSSPSSGRAVNTVLAKQAWDEIEAFLEARKQTHAAQSGRTWTRDELYEERLGRLAH